MVGLHSELTSHGGANEEASSYSGSLRIALLQLLLMRCKMCTDEEEPGAPDSQGSSNSSLVAQNIPNPCTVSDHHILLHLQAKHAGMPKPESSDWWEPSSGQNQVPILAC